MDGNVPVALQYDRNAFVYSKICNNYRPVLVNENPRQVVVVEKSGAYSVVDGVLRVTRNLPKNLPASKRERCTKDLRDFIEST